MLLASTVVMFMVLPTAAHPYDQIFCGFEGQYKCCSEFIWCGPITQPRICGCNEYACCRYYTALSKSDIKELNHATDMLHEASADRRAKGVSSNNFKDQASLMQARMITKHLKANMEGAVKVNREDDVGIPRALTGHENGCTWKWGCWTDASTGNPVCGFHWDCT